MTPKTKAGRADHDLAWGPAPGNEWTMNHQNDREGCGGCERIAAIEREAAQQERERLMHYIQHEPDCAERTPEGDCVCGLATILAEPTDD